MNLITIRSSTHFDIKALVLLSKAKRLYYEKAQPQFWKYAGSKAEKIQADWFEELLSNKDYVMLTAEDLNHEILGFIIGKLVPAPEVYNPSGLTLMIDDFCVRSEDLWPSVGGKLIEAIKHQSIDKGAAQILVVCGAHDNLKRQFLISQNLSVTSEWFVGSVI